MNNIIYVKKIGDYNDIINEKYQKMPIFLKKLIHIYKNIFNVITKKEIDNRNIWILPIFEKYSYKKLDNIIKKIAKQENKKYVISEDLLNNELYKMLKKYNIIYLEGNIIKKYLIIKILEYINNLQNVEMNNIEVTLLLKGASEFNIYLIEKLSKIVKSLKIITPNIYKFKKIEEKLYNEFGIAIQFSNSYKKSLSKSKIIINIDYTKIDINEYEIFSNAIIINCAEEIIKIKSKLFNGIVINSCNISFNKEIKDRFRKINILNKFNNIVLYESIINNEKKFDNIFENIDRDKVIILNLIGNNGIINKKEIKNIFKKLDKKLKTE